MSSRYVVVVGGANMDLKARSSAPLVSATSNPGTATVTPGGVGRNVAENLARLGTPVQLVAAVGDDVFGHALFRETAAAGVGLDLVRRGPWTTGTYVAVIDETGELAVAVADMEATDALTPDDVDAAAHLVRGAALLVLDANLAPPTLAAALDLGATKGVPVIVDPVSVPKAARMAPVLDGSRSLLALTPNRDELAALTGRPVATHGELLDASAVLHERGVHHVWTGLGRAGSLLVTAGEDPLLVPASPVDAVDVTGAGDAMLAGFCHALLRERDIGACARFGQAAAELTLAAEGTVRADLSVALVDAHLAETGR
ncbi:MAG TPA: carbohydrate kinase family protein [Nocardioides sp.]|uniref:carbohydrate kinase family protein n=1 Tax=Nocardioides sp. TaxID=35761 RepID=UPI002B8620A8|nr:carbohydrate kinase family protein [Nocardioides sp.]HQR27568.1 carbohydrate kinase family protein [Nocardioides sp.]